MRLYLDDDSAQLLLVRLLEQAEQDVEIPSHAGLNGRSDPAHLRYAIMTNRTLPSANHRDYRELHDLIQQAGGTHAGILIVRFDNDRRRDLTPRGIVTALTKLLGTKAPIKNEFNILNHWR